VRHAPCDATPTAGEKKNVTVTPATPDPIADPGTLSSRTRWVWGGLLVLWFAGLCLGPDPRPLGAPDWAVDLVRILAPGEAAARVLASLALRVAGLALLGVLVMLTLGTRRLSGASVAAIVLSPALAIAALWVNYGYFPITTQIQIAAASAAIGALTGLALQRHLIAAIGVVVITASLFAWGAATGIDDELDAMTRAVGQHVMAAADDIPSGDAGFERLLELAFGFAEDNSHGSDPVRPNQAAILALGVLLGDQRVAGVAKRRFDPSGLPGAASLRARITAHGRRDWSRHFWVSAALTLLSDADRSLTIGLTKELMDTAPGGSGFSFTDLAADAAGSAFASAATRDSDSARAVQHRIVQGVRLEDYLPNLHDLPEGLTREQLQSEYGGLGGKGTQAVVAEIRRRIAASPGLQ
jgi:hypothetical protein